MRQDLPLFPESASSLATDVDRLFYAWTAVSLFFTALIAVLIVYFMVKYRRRSEDEVGQNESAANILEIAWSVIPLIISLAMFAWGARVFFQIYRPPSNAVVYSSIGKQWMWKFQHPSGQREINTLHIPVGLPVKLLLQSEDVIHSFYVPAFRVKQDAVPGRETSIWFRPTKTGTYHLFCAEYCGTEHSRMIGSIVVMEPKDYEAWLAGGPAGQSMVASGASLFQSLACNTCHRPAAGMSPRGPALEGVYGHQVKLADGRTLIADDAYLRESILNPQAKIVAGWTPVMPTFQGQVTEEQLLSLLSYVRSLGGGGPEAGGNAPPGANAAADATATGAGAPSGTGTSNPQNP